MRVAGRPAVRVDICIQKEDRNSRLGGRELWSIRTTSQVLPFIKACWVACFLGLAKDHTHRPSNHHFILSCKKITFSITSTGTSAHNPRMGRYCPGRSHIEWRCWLAGHLSERDHFDRLYDHHFLTWFTIIQPPGTGSLPIMASVGMYLGLRFITRHAGCWAIFDE